MICKPVRCQSVFGMKFVDKDKIGTCIQGYIYPICWAIVAPCCPEEGGGGVFN